MCASLTKLFAAQKQRLHVHDLFVHRGPTLEREMWQRFAAAKLDTEEKLREFRRHHDLGLVLWARTPPRRVLGIASTKRPMFRDLKNNFLGREQMSKKIALPFPPPYNDRHAIASSREKPPGGFVGIEPLAALDRREIRQHFATTSLPKVSQMFHRPHKCNFRTYG